MLPIKFLFILILKLGDLLEWIDGLLAVKKGASEDFNVCSKVEEDLKSDSSATERQDNVTDELNGNTVNEINDAGGIKKHPYVPYTLSSSYVPNISGQPIQNSVTVVTYEIPSTMYVQDSYLAYMVWLRLSFQIFHLRNVYLSIRSSLFFACLRTP